jgi:hypothetical protein
MDLTLGEEYWIQFYLKLIAVISYEITTVRHDSIKSLKSFKMRMRLCMVPCVQYWCIVLSVLRAVSWVCACFFVFLIRNLLLIGVADVPSDGGCCGWVTCCNCFSGFYCARASISSVYGGMWLY